MKSYDKSIRRDRPLREGELPHKRLSRKKKGPDYYRGSGYVFEVYRSGRWRPVWHFRDEASMRGALRGQRQCDWSPPETPPLRMRFPNDGKTECDPPPAWYWARNREEKITYEILPEAPISPAYQKRIEQARREKTAVCLVYRDAKGVKTQRKVWPTEWTSDFHFLALCGLRDEERMFRLDRVLDCRHAR
ncbi:MAG: hypothetical protein CMO55_07970 [Verrucomicrobiales bacterium]|nr:hypothetical protein [Verrucomicrobiales bacterium]